MDFLADMLSSIPAQLGSAIFIFLFGLHFLAEGIKNATQNKLKKFFELAIKNRVIGALFGTIITGLTQSSTAVTVMTVGFVNAGVLTLLQAASIIVGANIGTTLTGHMMNIRFDAFIPLLMIIGGFMFLFLKKEKTKQWGIVLFGLGLFFIGLTMMSDAMRPLRDSPVFTNALAGLEGRVFLGVLLGAGVTALLNSSTAAKGVILSVAYAGLISDIHLALPFVFGMNIGTCLTALISSIKANKNAKRAAIFHLLFSLIGTLLFIPFIRQFGDLVINYGPGDTSLVHIQVANAHTFFNIVTAVVLLPFLTPLLKFINLFVKEDGEENTNILDKRLLDNPAIAFDQAFKTSLTMHELALSNLELASNALLTNNMKEIPKFYKNEKRINEMEIEITDFLSSISSEHMHMTEAMVAKIASLIKINNDLERIGDHAKNIAESAEEFSAGEMKFTESALAELTTIFSKTIDAVKSAYDSFETNDIAKAKLTSSYENEIDILEDQFRDNHIKRLKNRECSTRSGVIFLDVISNLERIGDHAKNIAEYVLNSN